MPCTDNGPEPTPRFDAEAVLCAVLRALRATGHGNLEFILNHTDWNEAGVTRTEFSLWWAEHQRKDEARRGAERNHQIEATRQRALQKLTPDERWALGL